MPGRFEGKVAVITGGASGIGLETAKLIVAEGGRAMVGDLRAESGPPLMAELGPGSADFRTCDVSKFDEVEALIESAVQRFGGLDILINNAGIGSDVCSSVDLSLETWHRVIGVDLNSVFYGCKVAIPRMRQRGGGAIVNTASISGLGGDHGFNAYNAAKGAVVNYTRSLALDHAPDNIRVNAVCPGLVETSLTRFMQKRGIADALTANIPLRRMGRAEEIARLIAFLASDDASYMTGSIVVADGGLTAGTGNPNLETLLQEAKQVARNTSQT